MLHQIIKHLWNSRRRNLWIMLELVVIGIVSCAVIDPLFVLNYNQSIPNGYEPDGLYRLKLARNKVDTVSDPVKDYTRIMMGLRNYKDIESATCMASGVYPSSPSNNMNGVFKDSTEVRMAYIPFYSGSGFFRTWRFRSAKDGTWQSLEKLDIPKGSVILSEDAVALLNGGKDLTGQSIYNAYDSSEIRVVGVMQPIKMRNSMQPYLVRLVSYGDESQLPEWAFSSELSIFLRTKENVSEGRFIEEFMMWVDDNLSSGSLVFSKLTPFYEVQRESDLQKGVTNEVRMKYALAYFFMINLLLAVSGTFWLNTRARREEIGIRLSYGASPGGICRMLIGEAFVMTTVAVIVGCFLFLQWAYYEGFYVLNDGIPGNESLYLTNHFYTHFFIVSLIVYVVMLLVTWLGVYIPARSISRISPVEALRDE
ncbi:ABC transporter permease [uncultured Bacteroides sp.]|uniref:ABC transporter permease n=1 Tax=uncultured Bacteroides sp. TaxID=162156 RepID=UPI0025CCF937|nr:FtsX-like permease family protein [uncultured Bacteroides sp.]